MIRVFFPGDTWIDLPEETPADPYGPPVEDEKPLTLEWTRDHGFGVALVFLRGTWLAGRVESWPEEARRLRAERDAAEERIAEPASVGGAGRSDQSGRYPRGVR